MQALILAGGRGTRLAPFTSSFPKPLVPVGDRPILHHLIDSLRDAGFKEIVLSVNYLASLIEAYFGDGSGFGVTIRYTREVEPLGTAGPIAVPADLHETFLVLNGDTLSDIDYMRLYSGHAESGEIATIVSYRRDVPINLGILVSDGRGHLKEYQEKPTLSYEASTGVYAMSRRVREYIANGERLDMPDLMLRLLARGFPPRIYRHEGHWLDIGRVEDYEIAQKQWHDAHP
jgi:NDP-sugar pyrophosphorylase family protein